MPQKKRLMSVINGVLRNDPIDNPFIKDCLASLPKGIRNYRAFPMDAYLDKRHHSWKKLESAGIIKHTDGMMLIHKDLVEILWSIEGPQGVPIPTEHAEEEKSHGRSV